MANKSYQFTNSWFLESAKSTWDVLIPQINPSRILEIGSFEGASACYLIEKLSREHAIEMHCVDTWCGGVEHQQDGMAATDMAAVEHRFHHNLSVASAKVKHPPEVVIHKSSSDNALVKLLADGMYGYFDFIYVDGSHQAPDVLCDAILSFKLLKQGGVLVFDDYLWQEQLAQGIDPIRCPKPAIDAFTNMYCRQLRILTAPLYQLFVQKN